MIVRNEQQYRHALDWLQRFEQSVSELDNNEKLKTEPLRWKLHKDSTQSQVNELREEIAEYERLLNCDTRQPIVIKVESLTKLPEALIKARIAAKMSQAELAQILDLDEERIQQYEETDYQCASFVELLEVSTALGIEFEMAAIRVDFAEIAMNQKSAEKWRSEKIHQASQIS